MRVTDLANVSLKVQKEKGTGVGYKENTKKQVCLFSCRI